MSVKDLTFVDNNAPQCDAEWLNTVTDEINNVIDSSDQTQTTGDRFQLDKAIKRDVNSAGFYTDAGAANAYVLTTLAPFTPSDVYTDGMLVRARFSASNTAASTVNVDGIGVKTIEKDDGSGVLIDLVAGDIIANKSVILEYNLDSDVFVLVEFTGAVGGLVPNSNLENPTHINFTINGGVSPTITDGFGGTPTITRSSQGTYQVTLPFAINNMQVQISGSSVAGVLTAMLFKVVVTSTTLIDIDCEQSNGAGSDSNLFISVKGDLV